MATARQYSHSIVTRSTSEIASNSCRSIRAIILRGRLSVHSSHSGRIRYRSSPPSERLRAIPRISPISAIALSSVCGVRDIAAVTDALPLSPRCRKITRQAQQSPRIYIRAVLLAVAFLYRFALRKFKLENSRKQLRLAHRARFLAHRVLIFGQFVDFPLCRGDHCVSVGPAKYPYSVGTPPAA